MNRLIALFVLLSLSSPSIAAVRDTCACHRQASVRTAKHTTYKAYRKRASVTTVPSRPIIVNQPPARVTVMPQPCCPPEKKSWFVRNAPWMVPLAIVGAALILRSGDEDESTNVTVVNQTPAKPPKKQSKRED